MLQIKDLTPDKVKRKIAVDKHLIIWSFDH